MNDNAMIVQRFASRLVVVARESGSLSEDPWAIGGRAQSQGRRLLSQAAAATANSGMCWEYSNVECGRMQEGCVNDRLVCRRC